MTPRLELIEFIAAFGVFFLGLKFFLESLQNLFEGVLRRALQALTNHRLVSLCIGFVVTLFVQSSSMTTMSAMGMANAGLMNFTQIVSFNLGGGLATSLSSWIFAAYSEIFASLIVLCGLALWIPFKKEALVEIGRNLTGAGLLFWGMQKMVAQADLFPADLAQVISSQLDLVYLFSGALLVILTRSSVAVFALAVVSASAGVLVFHQALLILIGANIGASFSPLKESFKANVLSRRAALTELLIQLFGAALVYSFLEVISKFVLGATAGWLVGFQLAFAHTVLSVFYVLIFLPVLSLLEELVKFVIKEKEGKEPQRLALMGSVASLAPSLAIEQGRLEVRKLGAMVQSILGLTKEYLESIEKEEEGNLKRISKYEGITDNVQEEVSTFLKLVMRVRLVEHQASSIRALLKITDSLEMIADLCLDVVELAKNQPKKSYAAEVGTLEKVSLQYEAIFSKMISEEVVPSEIDVDHVQEVVSSDNDYFMAQISSIQRCVRNLVEIYRAGFKII